MTFSEAPIPPPLALVLIYIPQTGQVQFQWPPQLAVTTVQGLLRTALESVDAMVAVQNGGIVKATTLPPVN